MADRSKSYIYLKGFANGCSMHNTLKALHVAEKFHKDQFRNDGEPYINHPLRVANELINLGIKDDAIVAAALLHDILEDCEFEYGGKELVTQYHLEQEVLDVIRLLTKHKGVNADEYYKTILSDKRSAIIKISDRCHNISTMVGVFTIERMKKYLKETEEYVLPLCSNVKDLYPEYSNAATVMKYHIRSMCDAVKYCIKCSENTEKSK